MSSGTRTNQVERIVEALASFPGGTALQVTSKKYPRFGPSGPGSMYEEKTRTFPAGRMPETLSISSDAEEITITLRGTLGAQGGKDELVRQLDTLFGAPDIAQRWDARACFQDAERDPKGYELQVFTH